METLRPVIRMCSGAVWEMSQGQEVTEVGFMAANKTTPARSEITLCRSTAFIVTWLPSTDHNNGTTGNEPSNEMNLLKIKYHDYYERVKEFVLGTILHA